MMIRNSLKSKKAFIIIISEAFLTLLVPMVYCKEERKQRNIQRKNLKHPLLTQLPKERNRNKIVPVKRIC